MTGMKTLHIAIVGTDDQVSLSRLGGVERFEVIGKDGEEREKVRAAVERFMKDPEIGVILIPKDYSDSVADIRLILRQQRLTTPVILEITPGYTEEREDVKAFYRDMMKKMIGLTIEL